VVREFSAVTPYRPGDTVQPHPDFGYRPRPFRDPKAHEQSRFFDEVLARLRRKSGVSAGWSYLALTFSSTEYSDDDGGIRKSDFYVVLCRSVPIFLEALSIPFRLGLRVRDRYREAGSASRS